MRYFLLILPVLLAPMLYGCGGATPPREGAVPDAAEAPTETEGGDSMTLSETQLYLYDTRPGAGVARLPLVVIQAGNLRLGSESGVLGSGGNRMTFEDARATIRSANDEDDAFVFEAKRGYYIEGERAYLEGGVHARSGDMSIELEDIDITPPTEHTAGLASTEHPVVLSSPMMQMNAQSMRLDPETKEFELVNAVGEIQLGELQR
jgi:hypothetical protein